MGCKAERLSIKQMSGAKSCGYERWRYTYCVYTQLHDASA